MTSTRFLTSGRRGVLYATSGLIVWLVATPMVQSQEPIEELLARREQMLKSTPGVDAIDRFFGRMRPENRLDLTDEEIDRIAEYYRSQFPFESLNNRLEYEQALAPNRPKPVLSDYAEKRLQDRDDPFGIPGHRLEDLEKRRAASLHVLHSDAVRQFVSVAGFGLERMSLVPLRELRLAAEPIPFDQPDAPLSTSYEDACEPLPEREPRYRDLIGDSDAEQTDEENRQQVIANYTLWLQKHNPRRIPTLPRLFKVHDDSTAGFAGFWRNGLPRENGEFAGFEPHAATVMPRPFVLRPPNRFRRRWWDGDDDPEAEVVWVVTRMQLVSLLKTPEPGVYVSNNLPNMEELVHVETRPLNEFESESLKRLRAGEDLVTASRTHQIHMMGALRAERQCLNCHSVFHGELLGAFSYELTRNAPIETGRVAAQIP